MISIVTKLLSLYVDSSDFIRDSKGLYYLGINVLNTLSPILKVGGIYEASLFVL